MQHSAVAVLFSGDRAFLMPYVSHLVPISTPHLIGLFLQKVLTPKLKHFFLRRHIAVDDNVKL